MKNLVNPLFFLCILFLSSCNDNTSKPDDSQLFADRLELSAHVLLDSVSLTRWGYLIKDTFKLNEIVKPRVTISQILDSTDIVTVSILNNQLDTIYVSRMTNRSSDSVHIFIFNSIRPSQKGSYHVSGFYYHKNIRTNLNQKILVYE